MAWLSVVEYAKYKGLTDAAIYKQIKLDKLITKKGEHNKTLIQTSLSDKHQYIGEQTKIREEDELIHIKGKEDLERIERFFNSLVVELKTAHNSQISTMRESFEKIIALKDDQLSKNDNENQKYKKEIDNLKKEINELKGKGFFKKLFGG